MKAKAPRVLSKVWRVAVLAAVVGGPSLARDARAQEFAYCDLSVAKETANLQLNGATVMSTGVRKGQGIVVTTETANQRSTVFHDIPITFTPGGSLYQHFRVRISGAGADAPPNGADGFAFMVQNDPGGDPLNEGKTGAGLTALGRAGEGFAYAGITQSFALELDTYQNANRKDPDGNHIGLDFGGHNYHSTDGTAAGATLAGQVEGSTVSLFQPVQLNTLIHSLESTTASYETRDVWIDYVCVGAACTTKVYMTFNAPLLATGFADPTNPATLPAKPATPILTVNGVSDITQYLNGNTGYAGFSASTGGSKDEHLVTYWVLSQTAFSDQNTNHLEDVCDCKAVPSACGGNIPICDQSTAQGFCRDCQSDTECKTKDPTKPICDSIASGGTGACVQCTTDASCASGTPNCNTTSNTCTANCTSDKDCPATEWCSDPTGAAFAGVCTAKLVNGKPIPTTANHAPVLNGTCTAAAGAAVCVSGVCDTTDNECGLATGDGTCTVVAECRTGKCITAGANSGTCEPCGATADCTGALVCNTTTNQCVTCTQNSQCSGNTPVCNTSTNGCVACNGNAGSGGTETCPNTAPYCNVATGACTANCVNDGQCGGGNWCDNVTQAGVCEPKVANGKPVPGGTCTVTLGSRACVATVCDTKNQDCGIAEGDGTCSATNQCQAGVCVTSGTNATKCEQCAADGNCTGGAVCSTTNTCVQCTGSSSSACTGNTPICKTSTGTCTGCTSDEGVASAEPCGSASAPYCAPSGACGHCASSSDCVGATHAGPFCVGGSCTATCSSDADCGSLQWCDGAGTCEPKLPNGTPLPTAPPIGGLCTPTSGTRVCLSAVCDPLDEKCGYPNGTPPPNDGGSPECRSGVVGPDGKCGYPNGQGPCTVSNGGTVCRSGVCDTDGKCGDGNGDGPCTAGNGATVCRSGVCDTTDGKCGLGNGDGPCTVGSGATVCRSGVCDTTDGVCGFHDAGAPRKDAGVSCPDGAVGADGHCGYVNGEGPCTANDGAVVCRSGVCDTNDGKCGYGNGDGPCSGSNAPTVCRSGSCNTTSGECEAVDASVPQSDAGTCPGGAVGSDGKCGYPNGEGPCTISDEGVVCRSGVCDPTDDKCGISNGNPPPFRDAGATECRSGVVGPDGKCGDPTGVGTCTNGSSVCRSGVCGASGACGCVTDADCGDGTSGRVCDDSTHDCRDGCRGTGGNTCPNGGQCSSSTPDIGTCGATTGAGGAAGAGGATGSIGAGGTAGIVGSLAGGGCACSVPTQGRGNTAAGLMALGLVAGSTLSRRVSRRRRQRR